MYKRNTFTVRSNVTCTIYCNDRIAATFYIIETWFVSGNIIVNGA